MSLIRWMIAAFAVAALTIGPAYLHGHFTNRWDRPADLLLAAEHLDRFPTAFGNWQRLSDNEPLSEEISYELGLAGEFGRNYVDRNTGEAVGLVLMVGQPGRLVRHPPEICYGNRDNERVGDIRTLTFTDGESEHEFSLVEYRRELGGVREYFVVAYGFSDVHQVWKSPSLPRLAYGGKPILYKMQAISMPHAIDDRETIEQELEIFLKAFVKEFPVVLPEANERWGEDT